MTDFIKIEITLFFKAVNGSELRCLDLVSWNWSKNITFSQILALYELYVILWKPQSFRHRAFLNQWIFLYKTTFSLCLFFDKTWFSLAWNLSELAQTCLNLLKIALTHLNLLELAWKPIAEHFSYVMTFRTEPEILWPDLEFLMCA